jgi:hypothetical protein
MRALIVSLTLLVSVAFCVAFLVFVMGMRPGMTVLVSLGLGLFMLAALFAALSALGPKFRVTPMLTPTMAGTVAAALATILIVAGNREYAPRQPAAPAVASPAVSEMTPQKMPEIAAAPEVRSVEPPATPSVASPADIFDPPSTEGSRSLADLVASVPETDPEIAATTPAPPSVALNQTDIAPVEPSPTAAAEAALRNLPPIPRQPAAPLSFTEDAFDAATARAEPKVATAITPPLPRSRPCGVDGLPCP